MIILIDFYASAIASTYNWQHLHIFLRFSVFLVHNKFVFIWNVPLIVLNYAWTLIKHSPIAESCDCRFVTIFLLFFALFRSTSFYWMSHKIFAAVLSRIRRTWLSLFNKKDYNYYHDSCDCLKGRARKKTPVRSSNFRWNENETKKKLFIAFTLVFQLMFLIP